MKIRMIIDDKPKTITIPDEIDHLNMQNETLMETFSDGRPKDLTDILNKGIYQRTRNDRSSEFFTVYDDLTRHYSNNEYPASVGDLFYVALLPRLFKAKETFECPNSIAMARLIKSLHRSLSQMEGIADNYFVFGTLPKAVAFNDEKESLGQEEAAKELRGYFEEDRRFNGRVPRICDDLATIYLYRKGTAEHPEKVPELKEYADKFQLNNVKTMMDAGLPIAHIAMIYTSFSQEKCEQIAQNPRIAQAIAQMLYKYEKDEELGFKQAAIWLSGHLTTGEEMVNRLYKKAEQIVLEPGDTVAALETKILNTKAENEIKRIEKRYKKPKFKFADCVCELKNVGEKVINGRYRAYIMEGNDERQVLLGFNADMSANSCQRLDDAGESAMMHGLLNPKAGFFIIEDKDSGYIKAQAECWELNEDTLVFDNMEFMNDAEVSLYRDVLSAWLRYTDYKDVRMGTGYNTMLYNGNFRNAGEAKPPVTPYECFVISYEEESEAPILKSEEEAKEKLESGEITYFDYVYSDSCDHGTSVWLKENGKVEPYFATNRVKEEDMSQFRSKLMHFAAPGEFINRLLENHEIVIDPIREEPTYDEEEEYHDEEYDDEYDDEYGEDGELDGFVD